MKNERELPENNHNINIKNGLHLCPTPDAVNSKVCKGTNISAQLFFSENNFN